MKENCGQVFQDRISTIFKHFIEAVSSTFEPTSANRTFKFSGWPKIYVGLRYNGAQRVLLNFKIKNPSMTE